MDRYKDKYVSVDEYITSYPSDIAKRLGQIRQLIKSLIPPKTKEFINYNIPAYKFDGQNRATIFFAAYSSHIAIYPIHPERTDFAKELKPYHSGTATLKFPNDKPLPLDTIEKVIKYLVATYSQGHRINQLRP